MSDTARAAVEAIELTNFPFDEMEEGEVRLKHAHRPPEQVVAGYKDTAGAPHYYIFDCVGTVPSDEEGKLQRLFIPDSPHAPNVVREAIESKKGVIADSKADARALESVTLKKNYRNTD